MSRPASEGRGDGSRGAGRLRPECEVTSRTAFQCLTGLSCSLSDGSRRSCGQRPAVCQEGARDVLGATPGRPHVSRRGPPEEKVADPLRGPAGPLAAETSPTPCSEQPAPRGRTPTQVLLPGLPGNCRFHPFWGMAGLSHAVSFPLQHPLRRGPGRCSQGGALPSVSEGSVSPGAGRTPVTPDHRASGDRHRKCVDASRLQ